MATRRCSTCAINFASAKIGGCQACGGELNYFSDIDPHTEEEIKDLIGKAVWQSTGEFRLYGGATMMERYLLTIESLRGADDFLTECGDWPAPEGNEGRGGDSRDVLGPPAP